MHPRHYGTHRPTLTYIRTSSVLLYACSLNDTAMIPRSLDSDTCLLHTIDMIFISRTIGEITVAVLMPFCFWF